MVVLDIITRKEAKALGLKRYFTGKPCKHGHVCERQVSSKGCVECESHRNNSGERRERRRESLRKWILNNYEQYLENSRRWRQTNPVRHRENCRKWRQVNRDIHHENCRRWQQANRGRCRERDAARRTLKLQAYPSWVDRTEIARIYEACPPGYHVDHEIPLNHPLVCGLHVPANLKPIPARENLSKRNSFNPETYVHTFP